MQQESGLTYFTYDYVNAAEDADYYYISYLYKAPDAFWMIRLQPRATVMRDMQTRSGIGRGQSNSSSEPRKQ